MAEPTVEAKNEVDASEAVNLRELVGKVVRSEEQSWGELVAKTQALAARFATEAEVQCCVCGDVLEKPVVLSCGAVADRTCAEQVAAGAVKCGCGSRACADSLSPVFLLANVVGIAFPKLEAALSATSSAEESAVTAVSARGARVSEAHAAALAQHATARTLLAEARVLRGQGDTGAAVSAAEQALECAPIHREALALLADLHGAAGNTCGVAACALVAAALAGAETCPAEARPAEGDVSAIIEKAAAMLAAIRAKALEVREEIHESVRTELECHLCLYGLAEPTTTPCGHSFCRACVLRVLDHAPACPFCRAPLDSYLAARQFNTTAALARLAARLTTRAPAEPAPANRIPIFVCTVALPGLPCPLHVFEPRYRLMMRRALAGPRVFGMCAGLPGHVAAIGTLLHINSIEYLPDGRSFVDTTGVRRFRVTDTDMEDGYLVATVEWLDDIADDPAVLAAAMEEAQAYLQQARGSRVWRGIVRAVGEPPQDPAMLGYWIAAASGGGPDEALPLLALSSPAARLRRALAPARQCVIL